MTVLCLDSENTTWNTGSPFDTRNFNVCWSYASDSASGVIFYPEPGNQQLQELIKSATLLVFFNAKYDLHWLRKLGIQPSCRIWCCQVAEYLISNQTSRYPSLDECALKYLNDKKLTVIEDEYWSKGINTNEIPREVLADYAEKDAKLTYGVYLKQIELIPPHRKTLFSLCMQDLLVLQEMEWNGMAYDKSFMREKAEKIDLDISKLQTELDLYHSVPDFNWASGDHLSALLYGGEVTQEVRVPNGVFKTGAKAGQVKFKLEQKVHKLPRIYKPIKGSELKKPGKWAVDEDNLKKLSGDKGLIEKLLKIKGLQKQINTYYRGIPDLAEEQYWPEGFIHGQFNQVVTATGRLSSTKPNLQNIEASVLEGFVSRWKS